MYHAGHATHNGSVQALAIPAQARTESHGFRLMALGLGLFLISLVGTVATLAHATASPYLLPEAMPAGAAIALYGFGVWKRARSQTLPYGPTP